LRISLCGVVEDREQIQFLLHRNGTDDRLLGREHAHDRARPEAHVRIHKEQMRMSLRQGL
jgi:hypothetical protein